MILLLNILIEQLKNVDYYFLYHLKKNSPKFCLNYILCQNIYRYFPDIFDIFIKSKYRYICNYRYFHHWLGKEANLCHANAVGKEDVQGSSVRCTGAVGRPYLVENHYAKGVFSGASLGTQRLGHKWLKGTKVPVTVQFIRLKALVGQKLQRLIQILLMKWRMI